MLKVWVAPNSSPSFTNFTEGELKILNDRDYGFRSKYYTRPFLDTSATQNEQNRVTAVATGTVSNPPSLAKPSVRLPPCEADTNDKINTVENNSAPSRSMPSVQGSTFALDREVDLPGMRWTEKWMQKNGSGSRSLIVETTPLTKPATAKPTYPRALTQRAVGIDKNRRGPPNPHSPRGRMQYKINIPQPSSQQMDMFHHRPTRSCNFHPSDVKARNSSSLEILFQNPPSMALNQGTFSQSTSSGSDISTCARPKIVTLIPHFPSDDISRRMHTLEPKASVETKMGLVNVVWDSSIAETLIQSTSHQRLLAPAFEPPNLLDSPPSFPFSESSNLQSFPFLPMLPQTPAMQLLGHVDSTSSSAKALSPTQGTHATAYVTSREMRSVGLGQRPMKHTACYEWNYYLDCEAVKDGQCQKVHVCEICASSEHRAAQHWHHLATAPLPEIQAQPKLSTFSAPPESPTLSGLKERVPLVVAPKVPLFVPTPGLEGSQKEHSQLERLKLRRRQAWSKSVGADAVDVTNPFELRQSSRSFTLRPTQIENWQIPIMIPPSSPAEKPIEVILPPSVRPFQRKEETCEETLKPTDAPKISVSPRSGLRPAAPEFEPSYPGAWVPFSSPTCQFSDLFKIPGRESRKIEIVAPKDKGKRRDIC